MADQSKYKWEDGTRPANFKSWDEELKWVRSLTEGYRLIEPDEKGEVGDAFVNNIGTRMAIITSSHSIVTKGLAVHCNFPLYTKRPLLTKAEPQVVVVRIGWAGMALHLKLV